MSFLLLLTLISAPQVEKLHDEGVQLKMLQTALTLLQSPVHAHLEVSTSRHALAHVLPLGHCSVTLRFTHTNIR